jgi:diguanylate cyclase
VLEAIERGAADAVARRELLGASAGLAAERTIARAMREQRRRAAELELRAALSRLSSKNEALEARVCKLESEAWTDPLTGLANRRQLESVLEQMYAEAVRYDAELSVFMIDLDGFKAVNDQMGHGIGDELLRLVGRVIPDSVRASDVAARYGGDEFVVLMPRTDSATAMGVAQRLAGAFDAQARAWQDARGVGAQRDALVSMSIGVASLRLSEPDEAQTLLEHADRALYAGKRSGKGRVVLFEPPDRRSLPKLSA